MSYLALARKWRPRTFSQLVGQEHINKALINALNQQRLHHAYLFTGTRGVGKTSVARILAKALNCETGISSTPCLQCDACNAIEQGRFIDLIEIDGASKTRVEDTRDVLDNVQYAPTNGRFKIYLIDEVHMLSQHSFNALLKTLEEPPAHVKFILATTDPQKLPVTVLSRCLQFNLKHLPADLISKHLQLILNDEHINYEVQALNILAQAAHGSMRDALSLLDQAITSCNEKLLAHDVKLILGYTQQDYAVKLLDALAKQDGPTMLTLSQQIATEGGHFQYVIDELLNYLHQIAVYQNIGDMNPLISPADEIKNLAKQFSKEDTQLFYQITLKGREEIHLAPTLAIGFNMTMLRMLTFRPAPAATIPPMAIHHSNLVAQPALAHQASIDEPVETIERTESAEPIKPIEPIEDKSSLMENSLPTVKCSEALTKPTEEIQPMIPIEAQNWASIIPRLKLSGFALNAIENAEFITKDDRDIILRVAKGHESLFTPSTTSRIEAALSDYYQSPVKIILNSNEAVQATPAQQKERAAQQKQQKAEAALHNDPLFQQIQQEFSAELVKNSIVPLKDDL
ncbi:DNA polymerase III subunit gamma/tau [Legionella sp. km535]|uniref:DNA polymerase III subunit gamma/tau n=1 Tax=Legionella sp. km535 TaxID=2498107 RepID=UPI000F8E1BEA|nr:DNA polymerase III subunit gamma/tau [Legionella sp. km535]RUR16984.1 DNA polymerase III subunit gamma/tau [Legionella sp. km535]